MSDIAELVESLDMDAALARTYERHDVLQRRAVTRRRWTVGGGLAAAAIALAIIVPITSSSGPTKVHLPAVASQGGSTTLDPNSDLQTPGYRLTTAGDVWTLTSTTSRPSDASSAPGVGASSTAAERARVVSSSRGPVLRSVTVHLGCVHLPEQIAQVSYQITPQALVVEAQMAFTPDASTCPSPDDGPVISLPLAAPLPANLPVVTGSVPSH